MTPRRSGPAASPARAAPRGGKVGSEQGPLWWSVPAGGLAEGPPNGAGLGWAPTAPCLSPCAGLGCPGLPAGSAAVAPPAPPAVQLLRCLPRAGRRVCPGPAPPRHACALPGAGQGCARPGGTGRGGQSRGSTVGTARSPDKANPGFAPEHRDCIAAGNDIGNAVLIKDY